MLGFVFKKEGNMFEKYVGKNIKIVWKDGINQKAISGKLISFKDNFFEIISQHGNTVIISQESMISFIELKEVNENGMG